MPPTPCDLAAGNDHHEALDLLLKKGGELSYPHYRFVYLIINDQINIARVILEHGIEDLSVENDHLHYAVRSSAYDMASLLIRYGADVNSRCWERSQTPLHIACEYGDIEMVRTLLYHGADRYAMDSHGITPYTYADSTGCYDVLVTLAKYKK